MAKEQSGSHTAKCPSRYIERAELFGAINRDWKWAGVQGLEPQLPDPESGVLPLDDTPPSELKLTIPAWLIQELA